MPSEDVSTPTAGEARSQTRRWLWWGCAGSSVVLAGVGAALVIVALAEVGSVASGGLLALERQALIYAETNAALVALRQQRPFRPPEQGEVTATQARRMFAVTDDAAAGLGLWLRGPGAEDGASSSGGHAAIRRFVAIRRVVAQALVRHEMPVDEYVWAADRLLEAHARNTSGPLSSPPKPNQVVALAYRDRLERLRGLEDPPHIDAWVLAVARVLVARPRDS